MEQMSIEDHRIVALERVVEQNRLEHRDDMEKIFSKLEIISAQLITLGTKPACPDPGACLRIEKSAVDLNRRVMMLEMQSQKINGIMIACSAIGGVVTLVVSWIISLIKH